MKKMFIFAIMLFMPIGIFSEPIGGRAGGEIIYLGGEVVHHGGPVDFVHVTVRMTIQGLTEYGVTMNGESIGSSTIDERAAVNQTITVWPGGPLPDDPKGANIYIIELQTCSSKKTVVLN